MFKSYTFHAGISGQHALILGAVHGDEIAGTIAQQQIISALQQKKLHLKSGQVTFIPIVNEAAQKAGKRYIDVNLNRVIYFHEKPQNNEEKIANKLVGFINKCDIMLDLHSTHCPQDVEFAFIDYPNVHNLELLSLMPVSHALAGWPQIYAQQTNIMDFCTEKYAHSHKKIGITIECGYHKSEQAIHVAQQSILNLLAYYNIIDAPMPQKHLPTNIYLDSFIIKKQQGRLTKNYQHLCPIQKNEVLAIYEDGKQILAPFDGYIIMPNPHAKIDSEWFYLGYSKDKLK